MTSSARPPSSTSSRWHSDSPQERGWKVLTGHIYSDAAVSGASINGRVGIQRLLAAAGEQPKAFDVLLVDDSSRIARDIPDAIRVMQQLKFLGIRVIYISQGIDSESEQADALVAVHGLIDSMYLKELAKKVKRGLAGQMDRGFSTGARQYGYDKVAVFDPSGRKDADGRPILLGREIRVNEDEAKVIRRIFEWAAEGVGVTSMIERLNREGVPGTGGKRWCKTPVNRILANERYLGFQIWGQQAVEREPATGRKIMRNRPRHEWKVVERPDMRIVTDELWARAQATRQQVREAVAPKGLARGKSGKHHSKHLFSGFARCADCGGAMGAVSGGKGSPRFGCRKSWQEGLSTCTNRLTIRIKVAEPQILATLQQLLEPKTLAYISQAVEKEMKKSLQTTPTPAGEIRKRLGQERRKLQNLVTALERGSDAPASILKAIHEREGTVARLEGELAAADQPRPRGQTARCVAVRPDAALGPSFAAENRPRKGEGGVPSSESRPYIPTNRGRTPPLLHCQRPCDLSALVFSFFCPADRGSEMPAQKDRRRLQGARLVLLGARQAE